jgi:sporulation protein, YlmC/YmxH family
MRLSELQHKDIVNLDGKKIGNIIDVVLDNNGKLEALVIETQKSFFKMSNKNETMISWDKINKIGDDVILIRNL